MKLTHPQNSSPLAVLGHAPRFRDFLAPRFRAAGRAAQPQTGNQAAKSERASCRRHPGCRMASAIWLASASLSAARPVLACCDFGGQLRLGFAHGGFGLLAGGLSLGSLLFLQAAMHLLPATGTLRHARRAWPPRTRRSLRRPSQALGGALAGAFGGFVAGPQHLVEGLEEHVLQIEVQEDNEQKSRDRPQQNPTQGVQGCFHSNLAVRQTDAVFLSQQLSTRRL